MGSGLQRRGVFLSHGVSDQAEAYTRLAAELAIEVRDRLNSGAGNLTREFAAQAFFAEQTSRPSAAQMHATRLIDTVVTRGDGEQRRKETAAGKACGTTEDPQEALKAATGRRARVFAGR